MLTPLGTPEDLARLKQERDEADRAYNEALTSLDHAIMRVRELPVPPPPYDEFQITPLNQRWDVLAAKPAERGGWRGRFRAHVWGLVAPLFERQQAFNSTLVDHVNRNVAAHRETARAIADTLSALREELERLSHFQWRLVQWAAEVTPYVDTKDRLVAGLPHVDEVRSALGVLQRAVLTLKRQIEHREGATREAAGGGADASAPTRAGSSLDAYKYVGFEDQFRGSEREIRERLAAYLPDFEGARDLVDVGCGRGEFLDLLRSRGISARGIDSNDEMAAICHERGLDATAGDALSYLLAQPDASLGGLFAAQVVEHLESSYLLRLLETAYHKLRPGSKIVLETINPACWYAFFSSYIRDPTHVRPLHPETLRYLLVASGFQCVEIRYSAPIPDEAKLQPIVASAPLQAGTAGDRFSEMAAVFNDNVRKLNGLFFTYLDYAAIGERV